MIDEIRTDALRLISQATTLDKLEQIRVFYFGKRGIFRQMEQALWAKK